MSVDILKDDLKNNKIRKLYLFYGHEEYLKKYYIESIEKTLIDPEMKDLNRIILEGKIDLKKISDNCETTPVFADKKLVIVKNSGLFKAKKNSGNSGEKETKAKASGDNLAEYLLKLPEYLCLVFYEEELDKRIKAIDSIKKSGLMVEFPLQKPAELVKWVIKGFKSHKKEIDTLAASYLVDNSEQGMFEILNEINKIVAFLGDKTHVNVEDIEKVFTKSLKGRIFDLTDAVAEKNPSKAMKLLNDMVMLKEPVPKIHFMITRHLRQVLEMKLLRNEGLSAEQAAAKIGMAPYAAMKISKHAASFSVDKLKDTIKESFELDLDVKTGRINDRIATELLIVKFAN